MNSFFLVLGVLGLAACSSDSEGPADASDAATDAHASSSSSGGHQAEFPACQEISEACHPRDTGDPGTAHDCHEIAHGATSDAPCQAKKTECLEFCLGDAGAAHEHDEHGGH